MPYIRVRPQNLRRSSERIRKVERDIEKIEESFHSVAGRLDWDVKREEDIDWMLRCVDNELRQEERALIGMVNFLDNAAEKYEELEQEHPKEQVPFYPIKLILRPILGVHPTPLERLHSELLERMKNIVNGIGKVSDNETIGFSADILDYVNNVLKFFGGDKTEAFGIVQWCKLTDSSAALWKGLYEVLHMGFSDEKIQKLFETKFGPVAAGVGIGGAFAGMIGSILQATKNKEWKDIAGIGSSATDLGKNIYFVADPSAAKYPVHAYTSILKSGMDFTGQLADSVAEYSKDGKWSMGDTGATGIEASVQGLNTLVSEFTFGIISLEAINSSPEEISKALESGAEEWADQASDYILQNPELNKEYKESGPVNRARILLWAIGKTGIMRLKS